MKNNGFILFSRFGRQDFYADGITDSKGVVEFKSNDEAVRYDQIEKIFTCGSGSAVFVNTRQGKYEIPAKDKYECNRILRDIVGFADSNKSFLDYTRNGKDFFEAYADKLEEESENSSDGIEERL